MNFDPKMDCLSERYWSYFLASSLITFFAGLILILSFRLAGQLCKWNDSGRGQAAGVTLDDNEKLDFLTTLKWKCEALASGHDPFGKFMVSLSCVLSLGSLIIYLIDASQPDAQEESCKEFLDTPSQQVDLAFNLFFMLFFIIRFIAADDKIVFWREIHSFVDYFTIPPFFLSIYLSRQWLGLRFLRALRLIAFPDILQYLNVLRTSNSIRMAQICAVFISVWLAAAGFIHLVEISGDPFYNFENANPNNLTYWDCVYLVIVTMSTVGYGDIYCETIIGRAFIIIFIMGALAMFASYIPEALDIVGRRHRFKGSYHKPAGIRHIVVCGHITYKSVQSFLGDFLHEDRDNKKVKCLFLDTKTPSLELEALFKRHLTRVAFYRGSAMNTRDLERVKLEKADACLMIVDPCTNNPDAEDAANIMRVISVKNFHQDIRVIVQLVRYNNKAFCLNLPSWTHRDQLICLAEMKLGFMAQGCLAPGFSTLMANLFVMRSYKKTKSLHDQYLRGAGMEIYSGKFSTSLHGLSFPIAAEICFTKLKILLVALAFSKPGEEFNQIVLNPHKDGNNGKDVKILKDTIGFFICQSEDEVKRVYYYCKTCHSDTTKVEKIKACECWLKGRYDENEAVRCTGRKGKVSKLNKQESGEFELADMKDQNLNETGDKRHSSSIEQNEQALYPFLPSSSNDDGRRTSAHECFDSTGLFHYKPESQFEEAMLSDPSKQDTLEHLNDHVVLCVFGDEDTPSLGLVNFVMPLRASNLHFNQLKTIVIIGNEALLRREWEAIHHFPKIYIQKGIPFNRSVLRSVQINKCHMCVILTTPNTNAEDPTLVDKEAVLCSLNIKTMKFPNTKDVKCIPMLTELAGDFNVQFLEQEDEDDPDVFTTLPFASGRAFPASVLNTLMSTAYFNCKAVDLIRTLISGGAAPELERTLAEGGGLVRGQQSQKEIASTRNSCQVALLPLKEGLLKEYSNRSYGELFVEALDKYGILCLGLYRRLDLESKDNPYRYVVTNPPGDPPGDPPGEGKVRLHTSDMVYCLRPFESRRISFKDGSDDVTTEL